MYQGMLLEVEGPLSGVSPLYYEFMTHVQNALLSNRKAPLAPVTASVFRVGAINAIIAADKVVMLLGKQLPATADGGRVHLCLVPMP